MFARAWRIGRILGVEIRIHGSWGLIALLVAYGFYVRFTFSYRTLSPLPTAALAGGAAALFFGSVLIHEMAHALVARARGIPVGNITLFFFGGATHARVDSKGPADEFLTSTVGPLTSLLLAGALGAISRLGSGSLAGAVGFVAWLNLLLAAFNVLPGFPLDGGRMLRSAIWRKTGDLARATRIATLTGQAIGYSLIAGGLLSAFTGRIGGGLWLAAIGWFLSQAARASYEELRRELLLREVEAAQVMQTSRGDGQVDPDIPLQHPKVSPETRLSEVVAALGRERGSRVLVVREGSVVGVITSADVARFLKMGPVARH